MIDSASKFCDEMTHKRQIDPEMSETVHCEQWERFSESESKLMELQAICLFLLYSIQSAI